MDSALKAVVFGFRGVLVADAALHRELTAEILQPWGIVFKPGEYRQCCLGVSENQSLWQILEQRGRAVNAEIVAELVERKQKLYCERFLKNPPRLAGVEQSLAQVRQLGLGCALVCGLAKTDLDRLLAKLGYSDYFGVLITATDALPAPDPASYRLALASLSSEPLAPWQGIAVVSTYSEILAAQTVGLEVLALPTEVPFHMLQRRVDWVVDRHDQIDWTQISAARTQSGPQKSPPVGGLD
ncbi:HAD family phosphatase [Candidatus Cyanaurora vandensis]|uniref:HAD family hydrolase n=1 Tax=Candidatus Cyanaurora vandensis TaxID=2714958 RepID=UPI00257BCFB8|nr:HAD family phosphatase [Candidatus Cyanaurora vandensis]